MDDHYEDYDFYAGDNYGWEQDEWEAINANEADDYRGDLDPDWDVDFDGDALDDVSSSSDLY